MITTQFVFKSKIKTSLLRLAKTNIEITYLIKQFNDTDYKLSKNSIRRNFRSSVSK